MHAELSVMMARRELTLSDGIPCTSIDSLAHWEGDMLYCPVDNLQERQREAAQRMLTKEQTIGITAGNRIHPTDTGSTDVQVALLTERIKQLTEHMRANRKDHHSQRGLIMLVGQRRRLLRYLSRTEPARYKALITKLGLRK